MKAHKRLQHFELTEVKHLKVHGRTTGNLSPLTLFWTGSALELNVQGSELWLEVESRYELYESWISVLVNGVPVSRQMLAEGRNWICLFRGMNPLKTTNVRIVKEVQAMSADPGCVLQMHAVRTDGEFLPVRERPRKIEFIGDSITSGEGAIGARQEEDWIPMWFSAIQNYTFLTAAALDAEYRVISQSGWGVMTSWDNNPHGNIPDYYEQVCGLLTGETNRELGAANLHDFSSWQPDVIVVNLGSNDGGAFRTPAWKDPVTGQVHKQRLNDDGSFNEDDLAAFERAAERFLDKLRDNNAKAWIVWAYGMLGSPMMPAIYRAVDRYVHRTGDRKVSIFQLPDTTQATMGARSHPGESSHRRAAEALSDYLEGII
ncbi:SGNH/GDSL hydrolase family protein [Paenibacillus sp. FSL W8-0426]|uniref:SGNH/GDSL hydrolase family protein n=1 Tax=Paenibacillus sp. FSL W8-0426 TaxID=2921714 RepID=UPI0030D803DD